MAVVVSEEESGSEEVVEHGSIPPRVEDSVSLSSDDDVFENVDPRHNPKVSDPVEAVREGRSEVVAATNPAKPTQNPSTSNSGFIHPSGLAQLNHSDTPPPMCEQSVLVHELPDLPGPINLLDLEERIPNIPIIPPSISQHMFSLSATGFDVFREVSQQAVIDESIFDIVYRENPMRTVAEYFAEISRRIAEYGLGF